LARCVTTGVMIAHSHCAACTAPRVEPDLLEQTPPEHDRRMRKAIEEQH
jgi:hypothetical protein